MLMGVLRELEGQELYRMLRCQYLSRHLITRYNFSQKFVDLCFVSYDYFCLFFISLRKSVNFIIA